MKNIAESNFTALKIIIIVIYLVYTLLAVFTVVLVSTILQNADARVLYWCTAKISSYSIDVVQKSVLKNNLKFTGKYMCQNLFVLNLQSYSLQLHSGPVCIHCEFCGNFKNSYFAEYVQVTASENQEKKYHTI